MQPDDALGSRHPGGDRAHEQRRGVRGQHRVGRHDAGERAEQPALELEVLGRGLDDHVAGGEVGEGRGARDVRVVHPHVEPGGARRLGDAGAHRPGAGDSEQHQVSALSPVSARPMISFWICDVPS